ncbi:MAG: metallophosphatase [Bacteroidia bacterium]|nr:metallophosphatase [Bacteroidia bacterium]MCF8426814.1 metallophosphatase [Bacteroidia bacterium]MCF8446899.1 metallophosphatase [Bacteroidia bacterium]
MEESQKSNRKQFIKQTLYLVGFGALANSPVNVLAQTEPKRLKILHTNDWHSRIEPFPAIDKNYGGQGGAAVRASLIKKIRKESGELLLLDAGDIFQGTPYFNFYGGELEYKLMSEMGYDCVTLGNHDFDGGMDGLIKQMPHAKFDFVNANYDFSKTPLQGKIKPYKIYKKQGLKIGVFGLGIELKGLVPDKLFGNTVYHDPIAVANEVALMLKKEKKCDLVICLSHLGYKYKNNKVSDEVLATQTQNIDLILGGHTHTFLPEPIFYKNLINKSVCVNQVGWAGLQLGLLEYTFEPFVNTDAKPSSRLFSLTNTENV